MNTFRTAFLRQLVVVPGLLALALLAAPLNGAQAQAGDEVAAADERAWTLGNPLTGTHSREPTQSNYSE